MLEAFCQQRGLTVNLVKTKVMLLAGELGNKAADAAAKRGRLSFAGKQLPVVSEFRYLGVVFSSSQTLAASAAPTRCTPARLAMLDMCECCNRLGLEATRVQLLLFKSLVDSKLSYGSEVWAPHLAQLAAKRAVISGGTGTQSSLSAPEELHELHTPLAVVDLKHLGTRGEVGDG